MHDRAAFNVTTRFLSTYALACDVRHKNPLRWNPRIPTAKMQEAL